MFKNLSTIFGKGAMVSAILIMRSKRDVELQFWYSQWAALFVFGPFLI